MRTLIAILLLTNIASLEASGNDRARGAAIDAAKAVVRSHEEFVRRGDLDGIMSNVATDIVMLAHNAPLAEGKTAVEQVYRAFLQSGRFEFVHEYHGAEVAGDTVVFHGVARGTFTPVTGSPASFANNFFLVLKKHKSGKYQLWRSAFAPGKPDH